MLVQCGCSSGCWAVGTGSQLYLCSLQLEKLYLEKPPVFSLVTDGTGNKPGVRTGFSSTPSLTPLLTADFCTELPLCCTTGAMAGRAAEGGDHMLTALGWQRAGRLLQKHHAGLVSQAAFWEKKTGYFILWTLFLFCSNCLLQNIF